MIRRMARHHMDGLSPLAYRMLSAKAARLGISLLDLCERIVREDMELTERRHLMTSRSRQFSVIERAANSVGRTWQVLSW